MKRLNRFALVLHSQAVAFTQILHRLLFNTMILLAALLPASHALSDPDSNSTKPSLTIPLGSYLEFINIGNIYLNQRSIFLKGTSESWLNRRALTFNSSATLPDAESCWSEGYDLIKGKKTDLACGQTLRSMLSRAKNAADFLYLNSTIVPYGSYLLSCTGVLLTQEDGDKYLYASCLKKRPVNIQYSPILSDLYQPNKLNITSCQNEIFNDHGTLRCSDSPRTPRRILTGSYLQPCGLSNVRYDKSNGRLYVYCDFRHLTLENAANCIGSGKDIVFTNEKLLECQNDPDGEVMEHEASLYLPAGNYLTTCTQVSFFPCLGTGKVGLLSARCADVEGLFKEVRLEDGDLDCRMSDMGYVSNINGTLVCDPSIKFVEEDPTHNPTFKDYFECKQSK